MSHEVKTNLSLGVTQRNQQGRGHFKITDTLVTVELMHEGHMFHKSKKIITNINTYNTEYHIHTHLFIKN